MRTMQHMLVLASILCAGTLFASSTYAQNYPTKQILIVVPYSPGGQTDTLARLIGSEMQRVAGQPVIVENKPGAGGVIAVDYVVKAGADGYAACFCTPLNIFMPAISDPSIQNDPVKALTPVTQLAETASLLISRTDLPVANMKDFIALAKKNSQAPLTFGSAATGANYVLELLKSTTNINLTTVNYKGEQGILTDLLSNRLDAGYLSIPTALPHIKSGRLKPLGVIGSNRLSTLPDLPTVGETVPGYDVNTFFGLFVPVGTPRAAIERLAEIASEAVKVPSVQERLRADYVSPVGSKPNDFATRVRADAASYAKLMK